MNLAALVKRTSCCVLLLLIASPVLAGPLAGDAGISIGGAWAGSTPFANGALSGYVDWAVYPPGGFPYPGYVPTPGEATYAYQVYVTGTAPLSHFDVDLPNPANNIGSFPLLGGSAPSGSSISTTAAWDFAGVASGGNTIGLAFSAPTIPLDWFGSVIDTGLSAFVVPIPSPSSIRVPEPACVTLLCVGAALLLPRAVRRMRNR